MSAEADRLHRTVKLEMDEGRAGSPEEALSLAESYVLQVHVGPGIGPTQQAMLLTMVNAGRRAFLGGVHVMPEDDPEFGVPWARGMRLSEAVARFHGAVVSELSPRHPTLVVGTPSTPSVGAIALHATWEGWSGGVVERPADRLGESTEFGLSGVLAGALAVAEAFLHVRGDPVAARRDTGISLWMPGSDWRERTGPACPYLPDKLWLLGLGHLGQAHCWCLGFLPYADTAEVMLYLQDFDVVVEANESTGLLVDSEAIGKTKARAVAGEMERLGFQTRIVERAFDSHTKRTADEPGLALAGFDDPVPRQGLENANFGFIVDAGLGAGPRHYHDIVLHAFPSALQARTAFRSRPAATRRFTQAAYRELVKRREAEGQSTGEAECGVLEIAGRTVGAAFVGAVAGTLAIAEALRMLCQGPRYQVIDLSLRSPQYRIAVDNESPGPFANTGFVEAAG